MLRKLELSVYTRDAAPLDEPENLVLSMDRQSAAEVAEHLAKLGHPRIAMIWARRPIARQ